MDTLLLRTEHRITFLDVEGVEEGLEVAQGHVDTVHGKGVRVGVGAESLLLVSDVLGPDDAIAQIEALGGSETIRPCSLPLSALSIAE